MTRPSVKQGKKRMKRHEIIQRLLAKLVGCITVVVVVAYVFYVAFLQMWRGPAIDPIYEQMAGGEIPWVKLEEGQELPGEKKIETDSVRQNESSSGPRSSATLVTATSPHPAGKVPAAKAEPEKTVIAAMPIAPAAAIPVAKISYEGKREQIERVVRQFFAGTTVAEKVRLCRHPERVRPLMEAYYQRQPLTRLALNKLGWIQPVKEPGHKLVFLQALFRDRNPLSLIAEETAAGEFVIDWESSVRYSEMNWKDFLAIRPQTPTLFRVIAAKTDGGGTPEFTALELKHPTEPGTVIAYFDRREAHFQPLVEQLELRRWKDVPLTLRLCYPNAKTNNGTVKIASVEGQGWLILENTRS